MMPYAYARMNPDIWERDYNFRRTTAHAFPKNKEG